MHPVLVDLGHGLVLGTHQVFVALGVAVAALVVVAEARRRGLWGDEMLVVITAGLVGGGLGMHAAGIIEALEPGRSTSLVDAWFWGAKSILGGLTGAYLGVLIGKRIMRWRIRTGDAFAPAVALGMAVGRWGCHLTEPPGRPTSLPWGVTLDAQQIAATAGCTGCRPGVPMHPSFVYEILFHAAAFAVLWRLRRRPLPTGALFTGYLASYAAFRFLVEFVRANEVVIGGLTRSQWFILALLPLAVWRLARLRRRPPSGPLPAPCAAPTSAGSAGPQVGDPQGVNRP